jgi:catechol 2,3-dioxygenase-like lactoylglutathione lyase family enzyme
MMPSVIAGAHTIIFAEDAEAARAFFGDVLGFPAVDAGEGWLIFALPPAELGVHPAEYLVRRDLSLMCDDVRATMAELKEKGIDFDGEPTDEGFGIGVTMLLPGGAEVFLYEPRHPTAI